MTDSLILSADAWRSLTEAGSRALPREVGGLLLGHYTGDGPRVTEAPVVPDHRATRIRYRRDATSGARILADRMHADASGLLGYLGEWHTHPLPFGPSGADLRACTRLAADGGHELALLVLALGTHGWSGHARSATPASSVHTIAFCVEGERQ